MQSKVNHQTFNSLLIKNSDDDSGKNNDNAGNDNDSSDSDDNDNDENDNDNGDFNNDNDDSNENCDNDIQCHENGSDNKEDIFAGSSRPINLDNGILTRPRIMRMRFTVIVSLDRREESCSLLGVKLTSFTCLKTF